ncbi:MAG: hypothetical protein ABIP03_14610 [Aquihabitans sp.]
MIDTVRDPYPCDVVWTNEVVNIILLANKIGFYHGEDPSSAQFCGPAHFPSPAPKAPVAGNEPDQRVVSYRNYRPQRVNHVVHPRLDEER